MSAESRIANRYAKSLVSLAVEQDKLEEIKSDIQLFKQACDDSRPLRLMLRNPIINGHSKSSVLSKIFSGKISEMTMSFFKIICRKGRENYLYTIANEVINEYNLLKGIQEAIIKTPFPITDPLRKEFEKLAAKFSNKTVLLKEEVDPELVGGFVLKIGDRQLDSSVKTQLQRLEHEFLPR